MNNFETADRLIPRAERYFREAQEALAEAEWNIVVRRTQEAVELSLKGVLKAIGIEYPKEHDVSGVFARVCEEKGLGVSGEALEEIRRLSSTLADWRAPAFYMEEEYDEAQARWSLEGAEKVVRLARQLLPRLKGK